MGCIVSLCPNRLWEQPCSNRTLGTKPIFFSSFRIKP